MVASAALLAVSAVGDFEPDPPAPARSAPPTTPSRAEPSIVGGSRIDTSRPRRRAAPPAVADAPQVRVAAEPAERRVRVLDLDGAPVEGVCVEVAGAECRDSATGPDGTATFRFANGVRADVAPTATVHDGWENREVTLDQPTTDVVVAFPVLDVEVIDATTGRTVAPVRIVVTTEHRLKRAERVVTASSHVDEAGRTVHLPLAWNQGGDVRVEVVPPPGFGSAGTLFWEGSVAPQTRRVRYTFPVYPATDVELHAVDAEGRPVAGVALDDIHVAQARDCELLGWGEPSYTSGSEGGATVFVRGLPALPVNAVRFGLVREPELDGTNGWKGRSERVLLAAFRADPTAVVMAPWDGVGPTFGMRCGGGHSTCCRAGPRAATTPVAVRVLRQDGTPAPRIAVSVGGARGTTGPDGVAELNVRQTGRAIAVASGHGFLPAAGALVVGADPEITLREPRPRGVRVAVTDESGVAVPGASVRATCLRVPGPDGAEVPARTTVAQFDGTTELLAPRTDPRGCVTLALPEGTIRYDVTLAGAAVAIESSEADVAIVLRAPTE